MTRLFGSDKLPPGVRRVLRLPWSRPEMGRDLDDEVQFHLQMRIEELRARGMNERDAEAEARRRLGDERDLRDYCLEVDASSAFRQRMTMWWQDLVHDVTVAARQLRRMRTLSMAAVLCLALGIGANTAVFSVVNAVLFRPLPFHDSARLVLVGEGLPDFSDHNMGVISLPEYADYRRLDGDVFTGSAAYQSASYALSATGIPPERASALQVTVGFLGVLGVAPARGRGFTAADADTAGAAVALISDALWRTRFGADASILGRVVDVDGHPATIVGVLPPGFHFPLPGAGGEAADLFVPLRFTAATNALRGNSYGTWLVARLAAGVTRERAQRAVSRVASSLPRVHPESYPSTWKTVADVFPLRGYAVKDARGPLTILFVAVALVLLIACINVSSILLARAAAREQEIAMRQALGASFGRLLRQFFAEGAILVALGVALGVPLAMLVARLLARREPSDVVRAYAGGIDLRVLALTGAVAAAATLLFSVVPALGLGRRAVTYRLHARTTAGRVHQRGRRALVMAQVALALMLTTAAGLMLRSFQRVLATDPGFDPEHLVSFSLDLPRATYPGATDVLGTENRLRHALAALPGVTAVSATNDPPLQGLSRAAYSVEGNARPTVPLAVYGLVLPSYFDAAGIRLAAGRPLDARDVRESLPTTVVNETLARQYFGANPANAIGHRIKWGTAGSPSPWLTIVGVVHDVRQVAIDRPAEAEFWLPAAQEDTSQAASMMRAPTFFVRTARDPGAVMPMVQQTVRRLAPSAPLVALQPMTATIDSSLAGRSFQTLLFALFAALALVLASVGLYGVLANSVQQRRREIGIRLAIGGDPAGIVRLVVGQAMRLTGAGIIAGLVGAAMATRAMASLLFGVSALDAPTFLAAAVALLVAAVASAWFPALRASRLDPQMALRPE